MIWGEHARQEAARSIESLAPFGLEIHVHELEEDCGHSAKAQMYELSPFDETLFLDSDTRVLGDLTFGFDMAARHGLAVAIAPACLARRQWAESPGARAQVGRDLVEYNSGVIFFRKGPRNRELFETWRTSADDYGPLDQWGFAQAIFDTGRNPFVLPQNWNFRAIPRIAPVFGPIKIWHTRKPLPENVEEWNRGPLRLGAVQGGRLVPVPL